MRNTKSTAAKIKRRFARSESLPIVPQTPNDTQLVDLSGRIVDSPSIQSDTSNRNDPPTNLDNIMGFINNHSLILENKGNAARDHMANERTFLAWIRTAYLLITMGIAFMQMYSIQSRAREVIYKETAYDISSQSLINSMAQIGKPLGYLTAVFSLVLIVFSLVRFYSIQSALQQRLFPATRVLALLVVVASVVLLVLVLAIEVKTT